MVKVQHLVVDSGGFLRNADIQSMGCQIYSIKEVVGEIRDKATRQRLSFLPYEIKFQGPSQTALQKVIQVAKNSGDYPSLSPTDLKVMALAYDLTLKHDPQSLEKSATATGGNFQFGGDLSTQDRLPGFFMPADDVLEPKMVSDVLNLKLTENCHGAINETKEIEIGHQDLEDSSGSDDGWITPSNIGHNQEIIETEDIGVGCVTTDFAMQNVLMKMGLRIISVDGMLIRTIQTYVLRCHACFAITKVMTKAFCPKCGNNTLKRVPTETQADGSVRYFLSRNPKVLNKRGKKSSLPMPTGGKHANNPILCEDQPIPQNRISKKAQRKTDVWSDDYAVDGNPFVVRDTESRAFKLGIRYGQNVSRSRNPNAVNKKFVKRR